MSQSLVVIGNGLGNLIEQSVLAIAAQRLHAVVDLWTPRSSPEIASVVRDIPNVRHHYQQHEHPGEFYSAVYATWLVREAAAKIRTAARHVSVTPSAHGSRSESSIALTALPSSARDPRGLTVHCGWDIPLIGDFAVARSDGPTVGLVCGSKAGYWKLKRYPYMSEVVSLLLEYWPNASFNLCGSNDDDPVAHPSVTDLRGTQTVRGTIGLLRQCDIVIASDSGLAHAAAAVGVPTMVIFGPTQVAKNRPASGGVVALSLPCQPCQFMSPKLGLDPRTRQPCQHACMQQLRPIDVVEAVLAVWKVRLAFKVAGGVS